MATTQNLQEILVTYNKKMADFNKRKQKIKTQIAKLKNDEKLFLEKFLLNLQKKAQEELEEKWCLITNKRQNFTEKKIYVKKINPPLTPGSTNEAFWWDVWIPFHFFTITYLESEKDPKNRQKTCAFLPDTEIKILS